MVQLIKKNKIRENLTVDKIKQLYWEENLSIPKIAKLVMLHPTSIYKRMKLNNIPRRSFTESNYIVHSNKPRFNIKQSLSRSDENLLIAGVMLYVAEGSQKGNTIDFANSDPDVIKLFLKFLREICGIAENRLRVYLYVFSDQSLEDIKLFWHRITKIAFSQFIKPYVRNTDKQRKRRMEHGLIKIRYSDKRLLEQIDRWTKSYMARLSE